MQKRASPCWDFIYLFLSASLYTRNIFAKFQLCKIFCTLLAVTEKKIHRTNQGSNFFGGSFNNRENPIQFNLEENDNHSFLKYDFSSRLDPSVFTAIAPVLLDRPNETSIESFQHGSCEDIPSKTTWNRLLLRKDQIRPID